MREKMYTRIRGGEGVKRTKKLSILVPGKNYPDPPLKHFPYAHVKYIILTMCR